MPGRFDFASPGAAAGDALRNYMAQQEAQQRQQMLDSLAVQREQRIAEDADLNRQIQQENIQSQAEARTQATADRQTGLDTTAANRVVGAHQMGDTLTDDETAALNKVPGFTGLTKKETKQGAQTGEDENGVPQYETSQATTFNGTPAQRDEHDIADRARGVMNSNPALSENPMVKTAFDYAVATKQYAKFFDIAEQAMKESLVKQPRTLWQGRDGSLRLVDPNPNSPTFGKPVALPHDFVQRPEDKLEHEPPPNAALTIANNTSDEGIEALADHYMQTKQMLTRNAALIDKVMARVQQRKLAGENPFTNSAENTADAGSLTKLTASLDALTSFENTAKKNIGVLKEAAGAVTDTGLPFLNAPIRSIQKMTGSGKVSAFQASIKAVIPEIARIQSQPNLTGQLTDNARHEIDMIITGDATMGQLMDVIDILDQDMDNRQSSLRQQRADIKTRLADRTKLKPKDGDNTPPAETPYQRYLRMQKGK